MDMCPPRFFYYPQTKFRKVMFSQVSVCPRWGRGGFSLCPEGGYPSKGGLCAGESLSGGLWQGGSLSRRISVQGYLCWVSVRVTCGRYVSYWNAFLFKKKKSTQRAQCSSQEGQQLNLRSTCSEVKTTWDHIADLRDSPRKMCHRLISSAIHKAPGLTVPGRSMIWLVQFPLFHRSTEKSEKCWRWPISSFVIGDVIYVPPCIITMVYEKIYFEVYTDDQYITHKIYIALS